MTWVVSKVRSCNLSIGNELVQPTSLGHDIQLTFRVFTEALLDITEITERLYQSPSTMPLSFDPVSGPPPGLTKAGKARSQAAVS